MNDGRVPRVHGGLPLSAFARLGIDPAGLVDFSVNSNAYGPHPDVVRAVREADIDRYPDPKARDARAALAEMTARDVSEIALGPGAASLLWVLASRIPAGAVVLIVEPTFCEFTAACEAFGARIERWWAREVDGFEIDLEAIGRRASELGARAVYLCSPNTPTGVSVPADRIARWAKDLGGCQVVLDQSFLTLSRGAGDVGVRFPPNVVQVRSLTKDHALAGVRVGYALATAEVAEELMSRQPAWAVGSAAQDAVVVASRQRDFVDRCCRRLLADLADLHVELERLGWRPWPSSTIFSLLEVGDAARVRARLLVEHGVVVRDCASFGLPRHIRISARPLADRRRLIAALGRP